MPVIALAPNQTKRGQIVDRRKVEPTEQDRQLIERRDMTAAFVPNRNRHEWSSDLSPLVQHKTPIFGFASRHALGRGGHRQDLGLVLKKIERRVSCTDGILAERIEMLRGCIETARRRRIMSLHGVIDQ